MKFRRAFVALFAALFVTLGLAPAAGALTSNPDPIDVGQSALGDPTQAQISLTPTDDHFINSLDTQGASPGSSFLASSPNCFGSPIPCDAFVSFTPGVVGVATAQLVVEECLSVDPDECTAQLLPITGEGVSFRQASPSPLNFGNVSVGNSQAGATFFVVDRGFSVTSTFVLEQGAPFALSSTSCSVFPNSGQCNIGVAFAPVVGGPANATLLIRECSFTFDSNYCLETTVPLSGNGVAPMTISTSSLPNGAVNTAYQSTTLQTTGATGSTTWVVDSGSLPPGVTLSAAGVISGTPSGTGTFNFTVKATDSGSPAQSAFKNLSINVTVPSADVSVSLGATPSPAQSNKPATFTITVRNFGPSTADEVSLTNVLPTASKFVSISTSGATCTTPAVGQTGTVTCSLGDMINNASKSVQIKITVTAKKDSINDTVTVSNGPGSVDPQPANNTATVALRVK